MYRTLEARSFSSPRSNSEKRSTLANGIRNQVELYALSATLYTALAEHGAGRPGLSFVHSTIHSALVVGTSPVFRFGPPGTLFELSDAGPTTGVPLGEFLSFECENEDDRGAKTIVSVYICEKISQECTLGFPS